jgi:biotin operon repressor
MSQTQAILNHLKSGRSVSPLQALDRWGCFRLAARIQELREAGYRIERHTVKVGKKAFASYLLDRA